eukprot:Em0002g941a
MEGKERPSELSADNYQLREELRQEVHHHELIKKSIEGEERQLELKMSCASVCMRAVQRAVEDMGKMDQKSLKTIPFRIPFKGLKASQLNNFTDIKGLSLISLWDIEANSILFDLLPLLLPCSKHLVVLSVVSLESDAGDMHSHMHERKHSQEVLRELYSNLDYLMAPPSIVRCSTVVVGTHTGKLPRDRLRARQRTVERLVLLMSNQDKVRRCLSEYIETEMVEVTNPGKRRNAGTEVYYGQMKTFRCMANQGDDDDSIVKHKLAYHRGQRETVDECSESSRGSCSPSKRPLLGGECPSNYISRM